jgi:hypothetical protein
MFWTMAPARFVAKVLKHLARLGLCSAGAVVSLPCRAGDIATDLRCPALSAEVAAEFEARARVDLSMRSPEGGELDVVCRQQDAHVSWWPKTGTPLARTVRAGEGPLVDALLVAVADVARDSNATIGTPPPPKCPVVETPDPTPRAEPTCAPPAPAAVTSSPLALGVSLGVDAAWYGSGQGSVGPALGVLVALPSNFVATVRGQYSWGLGASQVVDVRVWGATLSLSRWWGERHTFELGAGASAGVVLATTSGAFGPSPQSTGYFAGIAHARYALTVDAWRFALGPEIRLLDAPVAIHVDGAQTWRWPALTAGLSLDVATAAYGALW